MENEIDNKIKYLFEMRKTKMSLVDDAKNLFMVKKCSQVTLCNTGILLGGMLTFNVFAAGFAWTSGDKVGISPASCSFPLANQRILFQNAQIMADNTVANGTVLQSWAPIPILSLKCSSGAYKNNANTTPYFSNNGTGSSNEIFVKGNLIGGSVADGFLLSTSNPGLKLKLYFSYDSGNLYCSSCIAPNNVVRKIGVGGESENIEFSKNSYNTELSIKMPVLQSATDNRYYFENVDVVHVNMRAELIKVGDINVVLDRDGQGEKLTMTEGALNIQYGSTDSYVSGTSTSFNFSGLSYIMKPACRVASGTKDVKVNMNKWTAVMPASSAFASALPAAGPDVPVNINLECTSTTSNVRFKFEDVGGSSSTTSNNNINLYDTIGGNRIDGLEIEMRNNGVHIDVDNSSTTNSGSHGSAWQGGQGYQSRSVANFTARYIQRAAVTRNGADYTGPVTAMVNMWVTYD